MDNNAKVMVHGVCPYAEGDHIGFSIDEAKAVYTEEQMEDMAGGDNDWYYLLNGFELMQWTGLKDKNGVDIYEGDIVETEWENTEGILTSNSAVVFKDGSFWETEDETLLIDIHEACLIIGNIHQNPDLLK